MSRFTKIGAIDFLENWEILNQKNNTKAGFSGTLFKNKKTGELVISFRSTEFIDDAARDNQATNLQEIAGHGFAFGQIADMEAWYASLVAEGKIPDPTQLSVTGYSLGGHLATVFNLLRREEGVAPQRVVTFNGAGVGMWNTPTLTQLIHQFKRLKTTVDGESASLRIGITDPELTTLYERVRQALNGGHAADKSDVLQLQVWAYPLSVDGVTPGDAQVREQAGLILDAIKNIQEIRAELQRLEGLSSGNGPQSSLSPSYTAVFNPVIAANWQ